MKSSTNLIFATTHGSLWPCKALPFHALVAVLIMNGFIPKASAQNDHFGIISPPDSATVSLTKGAQITYDFRNNDKAHHIHLLIDDVEIAMSRKAYGEIATGALNAGKRRICVSPVNTNHTPIGDKQCITVIAE